MKKYLPIVFLFTIYHSNAQIMFQASGPFKTAYSVERTTDGGYVIGGNTTGSVWGELVTMKISSQGNFVWNCEFNMGAAGDARDIVEANDGGIISTGRFQFQPPGGSGAGGSTFFLFLQKTNSLGGLLWMKLFGGNYGSGGSAVKQLADHGFIIAGYSATNSAYHTGIYLIRTDSSGNMLWNKIYSDTILNKIEANSIAITSDGGYIISGYEFTNSNYSIALVKTDSSGNVTWSKKFDTGSHEGGRSVQQTADGGFVVAGYNDTNAVFLKTDNSGNLLWAKNYQIMLNHTSVSEVIVTPSGNFVLTGYSSSGPYAYKILTFMTDSIGNVIWSKLYGSGSLGGMSLVRTDDNGFLVVSSSQGSYFLIVKTDSMGNSCNDLSISVNSNPLQLVTTNLNFIITSIGADTSIFPSSTSAGYVATVCINTGIPNPLERPTFSLYPNPANDQIRLDFSGFGDNYSVTIFNSIGKRVIYSSLKELDQVVIETKMLPTGLYSIVVNNGSGSFARKLIVAH